MEYSYNKEWLAKECLSPRGRWDAEMVKRGNKRETVLFGSSLASLISHANKPSISAADYSFPTLFPNAFTPAENNYLNAFVALW